MLSVVSGQDVTCDVQEIVGNMMHELAKIDQTGIIETALPLRRNDPALTGRVK